MKFNIPIIILCGGRGKRLGKLSKKIPKTLVKMGNKSLLKQKLFYYKSLGINKFHICLGYKGEQIKKHLLNFPSENIFLNSGEKAGILKRIYEAQKKIEKPSIISYGDTLAKVDLIKLFSEHIKSKALLTLVVSSIKNPFGLVEWNNNKKVTKFVEKPILNHFIGYAVLNPKAFKFITKKVINMEDGKGFVKAIDILCRKKLINVFKFDGLQITVNSVKELKEANVNFNKYFTIDETF